MDSSVHSNSSGSPRKRPRENETESQRHKREKAAERQRRKRERDRNNNAGMGIMAFTPSADHQQLQPQHHQQQQQQQHQQQQPVQVPQPLPSEYTGQDLTPEEEARRDRVRAAARERQRKHRQLVKQRKMRELGLDMGNEILPGMDDMHFRVNADGQYHHVLSSELQHHHQQPQQQQQQQQMGQHEPPFPQGQPLGGQTFASTLLLSFSCAPLLKQHLLRTLNMTNDELASLEPILAEAWEHWDRARRAHYEQAVKAGLGPNMSAPPYPVELAHEQQQQHNVNNNPHGYSLPTNGPSDTAHQTPNEFRARFHRSIVTPAPFRTYAAADGSQPPSTAPASTPTSASGSVPSSTDPIDPHLVKAAGTAGPSAPNNNGGVIAGNSLVGKS